MNQHITLTERENAQITWCKGCRTYSLVYHKCAISFTDDEIEQFMNILQNLRAHDFNYDFCGKPQVILKNNSTHVGICLTEENVVELKDIINEALLVDEAFRIVYK